MPPSVSYKNQKKSSSLTKIPLLCFQNFHSSVKRGGDRFCAGLRRRNKRVKRISTGCRRSFSLFEIGAHAASPTYLGLFDFVCPEIDWAYIRPNQKNKNHCDSCPFLAHHKSRNNTFKILWSATKSLKRKAFPRSKLFGSQT